MEPSFLYHIFSPLPSLDNVRLWLWLQPRIPVSKKDAWRPFSTRTLWLVSTDMHIIHISERSMEVWYHDSDMQPSRATLAHTINRSQDVDGPSTWELDFGAVWMTSRELKRWRKLWRMRKKKRKTGKTGDSVRDFQAVRTLPYITLQNEVSIGLN
jgi:hypothetical protein